MKSCRMCWVAVLAVSVMVLFGSGPVSAELVDVTSEDMWQDPLFIQGWVHELGDGFPPDEAIVSSWVLTDETACEDGPVYHDPAIPNALVTMTNQTTTDWFDVHYVADPETLLTNVDGFIGNAAIGDLEAAFRIVILKRPSGLIGPA